MHSILRETNRWLFALLLIPGLAYAQDPAGVDDLRAEVTALLTDFHAAAAAADGERYFGRLREDAILLGSAPDERFTVAEYHALVDPLFAAGQGWNTVPYEQNVGVSTDGTTAWFDEKLRRANGMEFRTTGVLRRGDGGWKFVLISATFPVPNVRALELGAKIREAVPTPERSIPADSAAAATLVAFHRAGLEADLDGYLGHLAEDGVMLGTDVHERHTREEVRAWLAPWFAQGLGLDTELVVLGLVESTDGNFAWFDARLDKAELCELRGTGLLRREADGWKIVHYDRAFAVPNELVASIAGPSPYVTPLEPAALREDFALLRKTLEEWHPALYLFETKEDMDRLFDETMARLDEPMTPLEFESLISPVVARAHCVHTRVLPHGLHYLARLHHSTYLPVEPQVIGGRLYVRTNYVDEPADLANSLLAPGTELLSINGRPAADIVARLLAVISADGNNESCQLADVNEDFSLLYATHVESPERFVVRARRRGTEELHEVTLPALTHIDWDAGVRARGPERPGPPAQELGMEVLPDEDLAILTHPNFDPARPTDFLRGVRKFFTRLEKEEIGHLIVDLRANRGGKPVQGSTLVSYLAAEPYTYFEFDPEENSELDALALRSFTTPRKPARHAFQGQAYVLIGGQNTSTAGHVIAHLKQQGRVVLIGQEAGATYVCNDNSADLDLPATGLRIRIARTRYRAAVTGLDPARGVLPDHEVQRTVEDMLSGRDAEMELARELIRAGK